MSESSELESQVKLRDGNQFDVATKIVGMEASNKLEECMNVGNSIHTKVDTDSALQQNSKNNEKIADDLDEIIFNRILDEKQRENLEKITCPCPNKKEDIEGMFQNLTVRDDAVSSEEKTDNEEIVTESNHNINRSIERFDSKYSSSDFSGNDLSCNDCDSKQVQDNPEAVHENQKQAIPDTPEEVHKSIEVINEALDELIVRSKEFKCTEDINEEEKNGAIVNLRNKYAFFLTTIFQAFCTPSPTYHQILEIIVRIDSKRMNADKQLNEIDLETCALPQDVVFSSGETGTLIIRLLTRNVSTRLLALPETFQQAFFHVLIRLIMNETYEEYLEYSSETFYNKNEIREEVQGTKSSDLKKIKN